MVTIENIPDSLGYLVLNEDNTIMSSGGDLENAEYLTNIVPALISLSNKVNEGEELYNKISVIYKDYAYVICMSNRKTFIVKKTFDCPIAGASNGDIASPHPHVTTTNA